MPINPAKQNKNEPILPPACLGVLGGGQLGRMFTQAAHSLGYRVCVLDPDPTSPAGAIADRHLCASYDDRAALTELASVCSAITTEFENIPVESINFVASQGTVVAPESPAIAIAQNRILEKRFFSQIEQETGISPAPTLILESEADLEKVSDDLFPGILKSAQMGYDGKGQIRLNSPRETKNAWIALGKVPCVLEKKLNLAYEVSALLARGFDGAIEVYPLSENVHRNGILSTSTVPSPSADPQTVARIQNAAKIITEKLNYLGVLCIEFFILTDQTLMINEMATRPHNSGHYTLDATRTSQFEQHVRALTRLPLGSTELHSPVVMLNLLGDVWLRNSDPKKLDLSKILAYESTQLHLYGKQEARSGRKMGHINCVGRTLREAQIRSESITRALGID